MSVRTSGVIDYTITVMRLYLLLFLSALSHYKINDWNRLQNFTLYLEKFLHNISILFRWNIGQKLDGVNVKILLMKSKYRYGKLIILKNVNTISYIIVTYIFRIFKEANEYKK